MRYEIHWMHLHVAAKTLIVSYRMNLRFQTVYMENTIVPDIWSSAEIISSCFGWAWQSLTFFAIGVSPERYSQSLSSFLGLLLLQKEVRCRSPCTWNPKSLSMIITCFNNGLTVTQSSNIVLLIIQSYCPPHLFNIILINIKIKIKIKFKLTMLKYLFYIQQHCRHHVNIK